MHPAAPAEPQAAPADYIVESAHPRLLLNSHELRRLRRDREREVSRWRRFQAVLTAETGPPPEPGFAYALHYAVSGSLEHGRRAVEWAVQDGSDPRQLALVFDWCHGILTEEELHQIAAKLRRFLVESGSDTSVQTVRSRVFAAVAAAEEMRPLSAETLRAFFEDWWSKHYLPAVASGSHPASREGLYALIEILHAFRDHFRIDLRTADREFFTDLPLYSLLHYYPATHRTTDGEYRVPIGTNFANPDLRAAVLARAADLSLATYDPNQLECQFLQGWLMQDQFQMRDAFGAPYELLWANPYQPGLSYRSAPLSLHQPRFGALYVRSSWNADASCLFYRNGTAKLLQGGVYRALNLAGGGSLSLGPTVIQQMPRKRKLEVDAEQPLTLYLLGAEPSAAYSVLVGDEKPAPRWSGAGGIIAVTVPAGSQVKIKIVPAASR